MSTRETFYSFSLSLFQFSDYFSRLRILKQPMSTTILIEYAEILVSQA